MMKTKLETGRLDKRQCYHIIQSFKPGEITPELALEIAKAFAQEHLDGFEVVDWDPCRPASYPFAYCI